MRSPREAAVAPLLYDHVQNQAVRGTRLCPCYLHGRRTRTLLYLLMGLSVAVLFASVPKLGRRSSTLDAAISTLSSTMSVDEPPVKKTRTLIQHRNHSKLQLYYFNIDGRGEPLRLLMAYAGIVFEDVRFASYEEFLNFKEKGGLAFGQVPMLQVDSTHQIVQTHAIGRYIARISGNDDLYPADSLKAAQIDAIMDQYHDMSAGLLASKYQERYGFHEALGGPDSAETSKVKKALVETVLPRHLSFFESLLEASSSGWLAGTAGPSLADFIIAPAIKMVAGFPSADEGAALLAKFPRTSALQEKFYGLEQVKTYKEQSA